MKPIEQALREASRQDNHKFKDVQELRARNKAYKVTLEYCNETCDDVDKLTEDCLHDLFINVSFTQEQRMFIECYTNQLVDSIKDVGTRKLRNAFTNYILDNT